ENDGVLHRELRPRADREMRGMRRVSHEHDVLVKPARVAYAGEGGPRRARAMRGVRHQPVAAKMIRKESLARGDRLLDIQRIESRGAPGCLVALDDEGRQLVVETIAVRLEDAVLVLDEVEGERVEGERGAEPHKSRRPMIDVRAKRLRVLAADRAIH